ncbi:MAG: DoxX family membrane protein [Kofleriaceae bacterium]
MSSRSRAILRWAATVFFVGAGANHFVNPAPYLGMMPAEIPTSWHSALNVISGAAEILGGLGLILPATRRLAAWGLIALLVAVFPANVNMAINDLPLGESRIPTWALWARLPLQVVMVAWVYLFTRPVEK